jgi:hypothetical protein
MSRWKRAGKSLSCAGACAILASCLATGRDSTRVETSEEVANVYVSAYPAVPWGAISDKLEPKFNLSTSDARTLAAVTTQSQVNQALSTFAAGLAIGLPSRTTSTTSMTGTGGNSSNVTKTLTPGTVPSAPAQALAITDANLSPDLTKNPFANGVDATTQLMGGLGVFQLAQILDNQISKSLIPKAYQAHLLTLQVNLQPKRRDLPYDAYVTLTLMPGSWHRALTTADSVAENADELSPVIVYPLIVTDAMESSSVGNSVESIRQAALALSGIVANIGVSGGVSSAKDELHQLLGTDRNTLVTAGRVSDNTLRIRLGAQFQGSNKFALVPRTQNISVVVFTRAGAASDKHIDRLSVITNTTFLDAVHGGGELPSSRSGEDGRRRIKDKVTEIVSNYGFELNPQCGDDLDNAGDLLRAVDRGDYVYTSKCLLVLPKYSAGDDATRGSSYAPYPASQASANAEAKKHGKPLPFPTQSLLEADAARAPIPALPVDGSKLLVDARFTPFEEAQLRRVVAALMTTQANSRFSKLTVQLTPFKDVTPTRPDDQLVFLNDSKSGSKLVIHGSSNIDSQKLKPVLKLTRDGKQVTLYPTNVDVDTVGTVTVAFPAIAASKLMTTVIKKQVKKPDEKSSVPPDPISLVWRYAQPGTPGGFVTASYDVQLLAAEPEPPANPVSVMSAVLLPDATGVAKVTLIVDKWDAASKGPLGVRVSGAEVRAVEPTVALDAVRKAVPLTGGTAVVLTLGNLTYSQAVQLKTLAGTEAVGSAITLPVEIPHVAAK